MKIYISGKITGLDPEEAKQNFQKVEDLLIKLGHEPINPMKVLEYDPKLTWEDYMLADIKELFKCDGVVMQENWRDSKGARIERAIAVEMDIEIRHLPFPEIKYNEL